MIAAGPEWQRRLRAAATAGRDVLGRPGGDAMPDLSTLSGILAAVEERLAATGAPGAEAAALAHADALERLRARHAARTAALAATERALERLRAITAPPALLAATVAELCASTRFERALLSVVRDGMLVPEAASDPALRDAIDGRSVKLAPPLPEADMMRRRRATIVRGAGRDGGWGPAFGGHGLVAAPLVVRGQAIALLHAETGSAPEALDADVLWMFARGVAGAYETASLRRALGRRRAEMRDFLEWLGAASGELSDAPVELVPSGRAPQAPGAVPGAGRPGVDDRAVFERVLTRRELEVLRLVAAGEGNAAIAAQLVISEATVKSHVLSLLRKLQVANRAEASARYHRLVRQRAGA